MRQTLILHPGSTCEAVSWIHVEFSRPDPARLKLHYKLGGYIGDLLIPDHAAPVRAEGLWRHMCFELFLRAADEDGYLEFNFSPSTQWAAYRFSGYRAAIGDAPDRCQPRIRFVSGSNGLALMAEIDGLPERDWHLGLSAVIEEGGGAKSYWALAHPPGDPDFHHETCFALELPAAESP
ncbi:MAG TPA: DOMON-like domain-containing protein [Allosphingosinicella sp.]|nr:DOMON-like domain-containing protein [Allosphingosinicella sp.]